MVGSEGTFATLEALKRLFQHFSVVSHSFGPPIPFFIKRGVCVFNIFQKGGVSDCSHKREGLAKSDFVLRKEGFLIFHVFCVFTQFLSAFFVFQRKVSVLLNLISRYMTSAQE